ncbi:hypothetical protein [Zoogloea sp. 1C4]|uniref:hypothetical protein n=1 Tax=Zoogloea sp. 1C4 TaxID=2570190 RepID=UPI001292324A|nr:hypothetical protein [Zoogloea sp. 1C4]
MNKMLHSSLASIFSIANAATRGWRTTKKFIVIESDDWGSIRTSSANAHASLKSLGYQMDASPYCFDALETRDDLDRLYEVLHSVRDLTGRPACMTANMVLENPDFNKIRLAEYQRYYSESVIETLMRRDGSEEVITRWAPSYNQMSFIPQFHAKEHVRWWEWMDALNSGSKEALETFSFGMCGVPHAASQEKLSFYRHVYIDPAVAALKGIDLEKSVLDGAHAFQRIFGYVSQSAIAPNYTWSPLIERAWHRCGIEYIQGARVQLVPQGETVYKASHYLGEVNSNGQTYLMRNCWFEPADGGMGKDPVEMCLAQIKRAFFFRRPAVICSHRVNYVGSISQEYAKKNRQSLLRLLLAIKKKWPDVTFISTPELGWMIKNHIDSSDGDLFKRAVCSI